MTKSFNRINGKSVYDFPGYRDGLGRLDMSIGSYLKKHSEALVKDVGIEAACELSLIHI